LVTSAGGVPSISTTLPSALTAANMKLAQLNDSNGNVMLATAVVASAVNYIQLQNNATGGSPNLTFTGTDANVNGNIVVKAAGVINLLSNTLANYFTFTPKATGSSPVMGVAGDANTILTINGSGTGGVTIHGTTAADDANAGYVGELLSSANATGVAMTTATATQIQTLSLTAGDWDVWGVFYTTVNAATTLGIHRCQLHTTTATLASPSTAQLSATNGVYGVQTVGTPVFLNTGISRWNVSGATTVYLNASATYAVNTLTGNGAIYARRRR